jgi:hypothetical protein
MYEKEGIESKQKKKEELGNFYLANFYNTFSASKWCPMGLQVF